MKYFRAFFAVVGSLLATFSLATVIEAQNPATASSSDHRANRETLKLVVILSRHGVRSSTWTEEKLNAYSAQPWPEFGVAPGYLTSHGYELIKDFGSYDRASLAEAGLLPTHGCADAASAYIWADVDERTLESGRALAEGLFPGCATQVHSVASGNRDPIFLPAASALKPFTKEALAAFEVLVRMRTNAEQDALIGQMQNVLDGCAPNSKCTPKHVPQTLLGAGLGSVIRGKGEHLADLQGPLAQASSFSEDLLLEYTNGMPLNQVGWGNVDENQLRRFIALHTAYFDLMNRTPSLARVEASNTLFHIARTLDQGVEGHAADGAVGPAGSKLVVLMGHDSNLAGVASLLGLHWTLDGRTDDTPPGTELAFELWQNKRGTYSVRVRVAMQTLNQMRNLDTLTLAAPAALQELPIPACGGDSCAWQDFLRVVDGAVDKDSVFTFRPH